MTNTSISGSRFVSFPSFMGHIPVRVAIYGTEACKVQRRRLAMARRRSSAGEIPEGGAGFIGQMYSFF